MAGTDPAAAGAAAGAAVPVLAWGAAAVPDATGVSLCPGASISTSASPTVAVSPSGTKILTTVPATGDGISSTLLSL